MSIGGRALPDTIKLEHWHTLVAPTKSAQRLLNTELVKMAAAIEVEADILLDELAQQGMTHPILKSIRKIISTRSALLRRAVEGAN